MSAIAPTPSHGPDSTTESPAPHPRDGGNEPQPALAGWLEPGPAATQAIHAGNHAIGPACGRCATEAARLLLLPDIADRVQVSSPEQAAGLLVPELLGRDREHCLAALLDTKHRLLRVVTVSIGSVDHTFMGPREVFRDALLGNAAVVVLAHNHPSGDPEPSAEDQLVTRRLVEAGDVLGVPVLDHLVVAGHRWVSMARRGLL